MRYFAFISLLMCLSCLKDQPEYEGDDLLLRRKIVSLEYGLNREAHKAIQPGGEMVIERKELLLTLEQLDDFAESERAVYDQLGNARPALYDLEPAGRKGSQGKVKIAVNLIYIRKKKTAARPFQKDDDFCTIDRPFYDYSEAAAQLDTSLNNCQGGAPFPVYDVKVVEFTAGEWMDGHPSFSESWYAGGELFSSADHAEGGFTAGEMQAQLNKILGMRKARAPYTSIIPPYYDHRGQIIQNRKLSARMYPRAFMARYTYHTVVSGTTTYRWYQLQQLYFAAERNVFHLETPGF